MIQITEIKAAFCIELIYELMDNAGMSLSPVEKQVFLEDVSRAVEYLGGESIMVRERERRMNVGKGWEKTL